MEGSGAEVCFALVFSCSEEVVSRAQSPCRCRSCSMLRSTDPHAAPVQVMMQRLMSRAASSGRVDDNLEVIRKRFR